MELWFRRTYRLPPTDPRYLDCSALDMLKEFFSYQYDDQLRAGKPITESVDEGFDLDAEIRQIEAEAQAAADAAALKDQGGWETVTELSDSTAGKP